MKREDRIPKRLCFNLLHYVVAAGLIAVLGTGCGETKDPLKEGIFADAPVKGVVYHSGDRYGITGWGGTFQYREGETITFKIGGIVLGKTAAKATITPVDLVPGAVNEKDPTVANIARLILSLDVDGNLDNGIVISEDIRNEAAWASFDFSLSTRDFGENADIEAFFDTLNALSLLDYRDENKNGVIEQREMIERKLLSAEEAQEHLRDTLAVKVNIKQPKQNEVFSVGESIDFVGSGSVLGGSIVAYLWDFGDGDSSTDQNPSHTYNSPDKYTVTLTVTPDDDSKDAATTSIDIRIRDIT